MASTSTSTSKGKRSLFDIKKEADEKRVKAAIEDLTGSKLDDGDSDSMWSSSDIDSDVEELPATPPSKKLKANGVKVVVKAVSPVKEPVRKSPRKSPKKAAARKEKSLPQEKR